MSKKIAVIGSGFSALAASCYLAKDGWNVTLYEKNNSIGGRARQLKREGFTFDIGPTWYWMPDVFERFFADFNREISQYYMLEKLDPAYKVVFGKNDAILIEGEIDKIYQVFENTEKGSAIKLKAFMAKASDNYTIAIKDLVYRPGVSPMELITTKTIKKLSQFFTSVSKEVRGSFKNPKLISILEFPVLFLGAKPSDTPAFYSFMNYADFGLGTFYPKGGMFSVTQGIASLAEDLGVKIKTGQTINKIHAENQKIKGLTINGKFQQEKYVLSGADYHHTETLLDKKYRQYSEGYWNKKKFAPSALLFYVGFNKKIENVEHHTLFFDVDFEKHSREIYDDPQWPENPLFYASFPSKTDAEAAPINCEAGIFLIPLAPALKDTAEMREKYFNMIIERFENLTEQNVKNNIIFKESYCVNDFVSDYNSYKGNAYGLANTLLQTAFLRPKLKSSKVKNLFFTGQLTVPGPGVPPALISGKLAAGLIQKANFKA